MAAAVEEAFSSLGTPRAANFNSSTSSSLKSTGSRRDAQALLHLRFQKPAPSGHGTPTGRVYDVAVEPGGSDLAGRGTPIAVLRKATPASPTPRLESPNGNTQRPGPLRRWPAPRASPRCSSDAQSAPAWCRLGSCLAPKSASASCAHVRRRGKGFGQATVGSADVDFYANLDCDDIILPPPTFFKSRLTLYCGHKTGYEASSKELQRRLTDSMAKCFPKEVWDECEVSHPDEQLLKERAARKSTMDLIKEKLHYDRKHHEILHGDDVPSQKDEVTKGRQLATLAQTSGWQVIDVEEVRDVFDAFAPAGVLHVEGLQFSAVMRKLYSDSNALEIKQICEEMVEPGDAESAQEQGSAGKPDFEVDFGVFFQALTVWLDRQCPFARGRRCTLSRFTLPPNLDSLQQVQAARPGAPG